MFSFRITSYVKKARARGVSDEQIYAELLKADWSHAEINKRLNHADKKAIFPQVALLTLVILVGGFLGSTGILWNIKTEHSETPNTTTKGFVAKIAEGSASFVDAASLVYPDSQKFHDTKAQYLEGKVPFIEADLDLMKLHVYNDGVETKEFTIVSKGKEGSWWETPTGDYRVLGKEANHFSSIGQVWMPWSIQFYGNFFIHGWPYYESGDPVAPGHSGGCIRLTTDDAKELYALVDKDTPILVKETTLSSNFGSALVQGAQPPVVSAGSFLIANVATGEKILGKNNDTIVPVASLTKLMTAVVTSELIYLERTISVSKSQLASTALFDPKAGEQYIAFDLLYPLLMQSSNEAANIIAGFLGREQFVGYMNQKSNALGMANTHFEDPSGIASGNTSSANDLLKLMQYIYFKRSFLFDITKGSSYKTYSGLHTTEIANFNEFVSDARLVGVKNGKTTAAGETFASVWEFPSPSGPVPVAIILLGSNDRATDARALLDWVGKNVEFK
ncbi:MAG: L,D-transpeptidase family protein [Minisyncoccia bacterium]